MIRLKDSMLLWLQIHIATHLKCFNAKQNPVERGRAYFPINMYLPYRLQTLIYKLSLNVAFKHTLKVMAMILFSLTRPQWYLSKLSN